MTMKIHVVVFWVVTPYSDMVGYQRFGGCCLHLHSTSPWHGVTTQNTTIWRADDWM